MAKTPSNLRYEWGHMSNRQWRAYRRDLLASASVANKEARREAKVERRLRRDMAQGLVKFV